MAENRGTLPKSLMMGVNAWWGADYKNHPEVCRMIYDTRKSTMAWEEDVQITGMSAATVKGESEATTYGNIGQGYTTRYTHVAYSNGFIITREQFKDNQYAKVARARTTQLSKSFRITKETVAANILNRAANGSYLGADGVTLLNTAHPEKVGTFSNTLAVAADFSESALEDLLILIDTATDSVGDPVQIKAKRLIIPPALRFTATRTLRSTLQSGSANNDVNAIKEMGILQGDPVVWQFLTDADAWFVQTDAPEGLIHYQREAREIERDGDFDTSNLKVKGYERYSFGYTDPRGIYGSVGAA